MPDTTHIKMPAVEPLIRYVADGVQTVFQYPFPIFASEDMAVYFNGARQYAGFDVFDAGQTSGGHVTFDIAPNNGVVLTLERNIPLERVTDFLEGGDFSAKAINNELDYLMASLQQVQRADKATLKYSDHEVPSRTTMPPRGDRANKALGFDGNGDPIAVSLEGASAAADFMPLGMGAVNRTAQDKYAESISVKDLAQRVRG